MKRHSNNMSMKYNILAFEGDAFVKWFQVDNIKDLAQVISAINQKNWQFVLTDNNGVDAFILKLSKDGPYMIRYDKIKEAFNMYFNEKGEFIHADK